MPAASTVKVMVDAIRGFLLADDAMELYSRNTTVLVTAASGKHVASNSRVKMFVMPMKHVDHTVKKKVIKTSAK